MAFKASLQRTLSSGLFDDQVYELSDIAIEFLTHLFFRFGSDGLVTWSQLQDMYGTIPPPVWQVGVNSIPPVWQVGVNSTMSYHPFLVWVILPFVCL